MDKEIKIVKPGLNGSLIDESGQKVVPPDDWAFLPAGDAVITRKVTLKGPVWKVQVKIGRRIISKGIWASSKIIEQAKQEVDALRSTDSYKKNLNRVASAETKFRKNMKRNFSMKFAPF